GGTVSDLQAFEYPHCPLRRRAHAIANRVPGIRRAAGAVWPAARRADRVELDHDHLHARSLAGIVRIGWGGITTGRRRRARRGRGGGGPEPADRDRRVAAGLRAARPDGARARRSRRGSRAAPRDVAEHLGNPANRPYARCVAASERILVTAAPRELRATDGVV